MTAPAPGDPLRVIVVGAGISGLTAALAIRDRAAQELRGAEILVLEKSGRAGGYLRTETVSGYVCESGANGFLDSVPETLELVHRLGIEDRLQASDDAARRRYLYHRGRLHPLPAGIGAFLRSGLISWRGKLRLMGEPLVPARRRPPADDESIRAFAARRIGAEAADVLIDALVSGIFAGDPARLSLRACFPRMVQMETEHGGLVKAMLAGRRAKRRGEGISSLRPVAGADTPARTSGGMGMPAGRLTSFRAGIEELAAAVARELGGAIRTGAGVVSVTRRTENGRWSCALESGESLEADAIVLAGPAAASAQIVSALDPPLAATLDEIEYATVAVVCLGFDSSALPRPLDGFGFLVPRGEGIRSLGVLWDSSIYPGRAPAGKALLRVMVGGARDPEAVGLSDLSLKETVLDDLARTMGPFGTPEFIRIFRHARGIPQYTLGHPARLERIEAALGAHPGLFLAGNSYRGVAINSCVAGAIPLAGQVHAYLTAERSGPVRSGMNAQACGPPQRFLG